MDVLIDVRCLQQDPPSAALTLLQQARTALPGHRLIGLIDPARAVPAPLRPLLDAVRTNAYTGAMNQPTCLVQLAPLAADPLPLAPLLLHPQVPAITLEEPSPSGRGQGEGNTGGPLNPLRRHWAQRYDRTIASDSLWAETARLAPRHAPAAITGKRARVALLATEPDPPLGAALRAHAEVEIFTPTRPLAALPLLSNRFDRVISLVANTTEHASLIGLVARFGGAAIVQDSHLLAPYAAQPSQALELAEAETGRRLDAEELGHWLSGAVRPSARMLCELEGAEPLIVHGAALAAHLRQCRGLEPIHVPIPLRPASYEGGRGLRIHARATPRTEEACMWALEILRSWGVDASLALSRQPSPFLAALCRKLGLAGHVTFAPDPGDADMGVFLAVPGEASLTRALAEAACSGLPCVASHSIAEGFDPPDWVRILPEGPSPVLLAEAILEATPSRPEARREFQRRHDPATVARLLCEALGLT